jgi:oxygen-independent coproporphyrinogen-3 oxidase
MLDIIRSNTEFHPDAECSLETNPETVTPAQLRLLWELGFSRISLGVQDLNQDVQWAIGRCHPYEKVQEIVSICRDSGYNSVNFDLVYGLPKQTLSSFSHTVEKVCSLEPDRVALYHFAYLPAKKPHQRLLDASSFPSSKENFHIFQAATSIFKSNGYESVGMDHFAKYDDPLALASRERRLKRSFMGYEPNPVQNFLGIGPSAISFLDSAYLRNIPSLYAWQHAIDEGRFGQDLWRKLTPEDSSRHSLINDLLCNLEIKDNVFTRVLGSQAQGIFPILEEFVSENLLRRKGNGWEVTGLGRPFVRAIAKTFDAYYNEMPKKDRPFSNVS